MRLRLSHHSKEAHSKEKWNTITIKSAYELGNISSLKMLEGRTADTIYGLASDGCYVGLVVSKENNGERVVITGFSAPLEYWQGL